MAWVQSSRIRQLMLQPSSRSLLSDLGAETWSGLWVLRARQMKTLNVARAAFSVRHWAAAEQKTELRNYKLWPNFRKLRNYPLSTWVEKEQMSGFFLEIWWIEINASLTNISPKLLVDRKSFFLFLLRLRPRRPEGPEPKEQLCNLSKFSNSGGDLAEREIGWCMVDDT